MEGSGHRDLHYSYGGHWEVERLSYLSQDKQLVCYSNPGSLTAKPALYFSLTKLLYSKAEFLGGVDSLTSVSTYKFV